MKTNTQKTVSKMKNMKYAGFVILALGAMLTMSCAKDEDLEDYKTRQFEQDEAKLASSNGTYTGFAISEADNKTKLGALQLTLQASSQEIASSDQSRTTVQPVLNVNLDFQGETLSTIHTQSGSYDPNSGVFQAQITVSTLGNSTGTSSSSSTTTTSGTTTAASTSYVININGLLSATGALSGTLEAQGFPGFGFTFNLQRGGPSLSQLAAQATPKALLTNLNYRGQTTFSNGGVTKDVNLTILNPTTNAEQEFINVVVPVKTFMTKLVYGSDAEIPFPNTTFDERTGQLRGQGTITAVIPGSSNNANTGGSSGNSSSASGTLSGSSGTQVTIFLACQQSAQGFDCQNTTDASSTPVAVTRVAAVNGPAKPISDDPNMRKQIQYQYRGLGTVRGSTADDPSGVHHKPVQKLFVMTVTYQLRSRLEEIIQLFSPTNEEEYVQIGMAISDPDGNGSYGDYFPDAILDTPAQTIQGNTTFTTPGNSTPASTQLSCQDFKFVNPGPKDMKYQFTCNYTSTLTNGPIQVSFKK